MNCRIALKTLIIMLGYSCFNFAQAATIVNLSEKPQTVEVQDASGFRPVIIEPNRNFREIGRIVIRYKEMVVRLDENEEYAIWKNGDFGPQKYHIHSRGTAQF